MADPITAEQDVQIRRLLWANHGCPTAAAYGDDGEMQCNAMGCMQDFKRDSLVALTFRALGSLRQQGADAIERLTWQPIETAPKDGTAVLLYYPKRYQMTGGVTWGCFIDGEWLDSTITTDNDCTHWMPLPAPPTRLEREL